MQEFHRTGQLLVHEESDVDIWMRFGLDKTERPEEIINQMQYDVSLFVEKIIKDGPAIAILEGRKATFMVHHMETRLKEENFAIQSLYYYRLDNSFSHFTRLCTENPSIIITDSIHLGRKMSRTLSYLKEKGVQIRGVYSYLSTKAGLKKVLETKIVTSKQLYSHLFAEDELEYRKKSGAIHTYFNSRIEPMETETPFLLYRINPAPSRKKMRILLRESLETIVESKVIKVSASNSRLPRNIWKLGFNINRSDMLEFIHRLPSKYLKPFTLNYAYVHFKIRQRNNSLDFTVIPEIDLALDNVRDDEHINCLFNTTETQFDFCFLFGHNKNENRVLSCAACLGNIVSLALMSSIEISVSRIFDREHIKYRLEREYIPIQKKIEDIRKSLDKRPSASTSKKRIR
jgi:hypothetical protein